MCRPGPRYLRTIDAASTLEATAGYRTTTATLRAERRRHARDGGAGPAAVDVHRERRATRAASAPHLVRAGADVQRFPVDERFAMALTSPTFNVPGSLRLQRGAAALRPDPRRHAVLFEDRRTRPRRRARSSSRRLRWARCHDQRRASATTSTASWSTAASCSRASASPTRCRAATWCCARPTTATTRRRRTRTCCCRIRRRPAGWRPPACAKRSAAPTGRSGRSGRTSTKSACSSPPAGASRSTGRPTASTRAISRTTTTSSTPASSSRPRCSGST